MEKNYNDLIVELVKKHHKYPEYESILDDIVADVKEHSRVVLETIDNFDVIEAYLTKIVSTSMVTVPKRLNMKTRKSVSYELPVVEKIEDVFTDLEKHESCTDLDSEPVEEIVSVEIVDVNSADDENCLESISGEEFKDEIFITNDPASEELKVEFLESDEAGVLESTSLQVEENDEHLDVNIESPLEAEDLNESTFEQSQQVDLSLVDKMINGVTVDSKIISEQDNCEADDNLEEIELEYDSLDELELVDEVIPEQESLEELEVIEEDDLEQETLNEFENIEEADVLTDLDSVQEEVEGLSIGDVEGLPENDVLQEDESILEDESTVLVEENVVNDIDFSNKYQAFAYEPKLKEFDSDMICSDLKEVDSKYSEFNILKVCELKFYQKKTIQEISEILNVSKDSVIEALNIVVDIVKD